MARKVFRPEQIIHMLREPEVRLAGGSTVSEVCRALNISERKACKVIGQPRSTQRRVLVQRDEETALIQAILKGEMVRPGVTSGHHFRRFYGHRRAGC
jgi:hypothetical protein